nr:hypothetical protein [Nitrosomonas nitrosa]
MTDGARHEKCGCGNGGNVNGPDQTALLSDGAVPKPVKVAVPQGYDAKFNLRIVPGHSLTGTILEQPGCKPRGNGSQGWETGVVAINPALIATLTKADKAIVAWLAKDTANAQRFLSNPVTAMREAGIELTRKEEKALARLASDAETARHVPPGANVEGLAASVFPSGRVGAIGKPKKDGQASDFDCGPKRKKG